MQGCGACHSAPSWSGLSVEVPDEVRAGETARVRIVLTAAASVGGFNLVSLQSFGHGLSLQPGDGTRIINTTELTHSAPKRFEGGQAIWEMTLVAPRAVGNYEVALYAVAANGNGMNTLDQLGALTRSVVVGPALVSDGGSATVELSEAPGCSAAGEGTALLALAAVVARLRLSRSPGGQPGGCARSRSLRRGRSCAPSEARRPCVRRGSASALCRSSSTTERAARALCTGAR